VAERKNGQSGGSYRESQAARPVAQKKKFRPGSDVEEGTTGERATKKEIDIG